MQDRPPSVDRLARSMANSGLPHPILVDLAREAIADGTPNEAPARAEHVRRTMLQPVINATGVLLHTNLGRAPFAAPVVEGYTNLELDLATGQRGSRHAHAGALLAKACGAEAAIVVNNCAAAVLLVLAAMAANQDVVVSRGELVEIGGGFRVPEVMAQSGARLYEVGTTNRTRAADYEKAVNDPGRSVAMVMQVHQSNYRIVGFTEAPNTHQLAEFGVPLVCDIGSGLLDSACPWLPGGPPAWLANEPAARQSLAAGAGLVTFSGDKLLGGPQAGIIAGRADLVARCRSHPLARALRPGSLVLGALQHLAMAYLARDVGAIPFWRMATEPIDALRVRAQHCLAELGTSPVAVGMVNAMSVPGGGTLPGAEIPSVALALDGDHVSALRDSPRPIIARVKDQTTYLDLRTIHPDDDGAVIRALRTMGA